MKTVFPYQGQALVRRTDAGGLYILLGCPLCGAGPGYATGVSELISTYPPEVVVEQAHHAGCQELNR